MKKLRDDNAGEKSKFDEQMKKLRDDNIDYKAKFDD
jgi:hypothetical protein